MRKADAWQWLDTANFRKSLPERAKAHEWNALYALSPDEFIVTREQLQTWARGDETGWIEKEIMGLLTGDTGRG